MRVRRTGEAALTAISKWCTFQSMSEVRGLPSVRTSAHRPSVKAEYWAGLILGVFFVVSFLSMRHQTPTVDEGGHRRYGRQILGLNSNRLQVSPPWSPS